MLLAKRPEDTLPALLLLALAPVQAACEPLPAPEPRVVALDALPALWETAAGCPVLVELAATWCAPCRLLEPRLREVLAPRVARGLRVVSVSADPRDGPWRAWLRDHPPLGISVRLEDWTVPDLARAFASTGAAFQGAIPYLLLLDGRGGLVLELTEPEDLAPLEAAIDRLLEGAPASRP